MHSNALRSTSDARFIAAFAAVLALCGTACAPADESSPFAAQTNDEPLDQAEVPQVDRSEWAVPAPSEGAAAFAEPTPPASALWHFGDCSPRTRTLLDSSGNDIHASRTLSVSCVDSPQVLGPWPYYAVGFDEPGDRVEALNGPQFAFRQNLAVSAWILPKSTAGIRPIVVKRLQSETAFSLRIQNGSLLFSVKLMDGLTYTARAPIQQGNWTHVGGQFDGRFVYLFLNGEQVGQLYARGTIQDVDAPLRIGATTQTQHFMGNIDEVWISNQRVTQSQVAGLGCVRNPPASSLTPGDSDPVPAGTTVSYRVTIYNRDFGGCSPRHYQLFGVPPSGFTSSSEPPVVRDVPPQSSATFLFQVTSSEHVDPGLRYIPFSVVDPDTFELIHDSWVTYTVAEPVGCHVKTRRELLIGDSSVMDDPWSTSFQGPADDPRTGAWTFGRLMEHAAPSPELAPEMVERMFRSWEEAQTINSFVVQPRPDVALQVLGSWPRREDGALDLRQSPLKLLAITNRFDLRDLDEGHAGRVHFVFGVLDPFGQPQSFTLIAEFLMPATTEQEALAWAQQWHALSAHAFPSDAYNAALAALTNRVTARNAIPGRVNGSALHALRTNQIGAYPAWELREFRLGASGFLEPTPVERTPDWSFNGTSALATFINANEQEILDETHRVPQRFEGLPFLGGSSLMDGTPWWAPNVSNEARHKFALNTCNGCHTAETGYPVHHIHPVVGFEAPLSGYLTGASVLDPISGDVREMNDLRRRNADLAGIVCGAEAGVPVPSLRKGVDRVH